MMEGKIEIEFIDKHLGKMMIKKWNDNGVWLFRKHQDGKWLTHRKATKADISAVISLLSDDSVIPNIVFKEDDGN